MKKYFTIRKLGLVVTVIALLCITTVAFAASYTNNDAESVDGTSVNKTVAASAGTVADVNATITFQKTDGDCVEPLPGDAFNEEIYFRLTSPGGTTVNLVNTNTYTGGGDGGVVTVALDDSAGTVVGGGTPVSGTFRPVSALSAFNGQSAAGTWTLVVGDSAEVQPLCFKSFTLDINGASGSGAEVRDDRINWKHGDDYAAIYPRKDAKGNPILNIFCIDAKGNGLFGYTLTQEMFNKAPAKPDKNTLVGETSVCRVPIKFYVLTSGEYQINIGPSAEGKVDVIVFTGLPPTNIHYHRLKW
jgi:hypothetical protein